MSDFTKDEDNKKLDLAAIKISSERSYDNEQPAGSNGCGCLLVVTGLFFMATSLLAYLAVEFARGFGKAGWGGRARGFTEYDLWILLGGIGGFALFVFGPLIASKIDS